MHRFQHQSMYLLRLGNLIFRFTSNRHESGPHVNLLLGFDHKETTQTLERL